VSVLALFVLLLLVLVPGTGALLAFDPTARLSSTTRLALAFALGYAIPGAIAFLLVLLSIFSAPLFLALLGVATLACWTVAVRRGAPRAHLQAVREEVRTERWPLVLGLAALAAFAVVRSGYLGDFPAGTPYRYWVDGMEVADAGGIPPSTLHHGALWPPVTSKMFLNAFTAGAHVLTGWSVPAAIVAMLWVTAIGSFVGLWATARELGLRWVAPLVPVLLLANRAIFGDEMTLDLLEYRAEIVGRLVVFCALPLGIVALRDRIRRRDAVVTGLLLAAAAGTHLVALTAGVIVLACYGLARLVLDRERRPVLRQGLLLGGITIVVAAAVLILPRGEIGFGGAADPSQYAATDVTFDKSRFLYSGSLAPADHPPRGRFYVPPGGVLAAFVQEGLRPPPGSILTGPAGTMALALGGLALALLVFLRFPRELRPIGPIAVGLGGILAGAALFFSWRYDVFIPATFGIRRLTDYAAVPVVLLLSGVAEVGLRAMRRVGPRGPVAGATVLVVLVTLLVLPSGRVTAEQVRRNHLAREAFAWIRSEVPCDARILLNQRTVGAVRALTGRVAVLEGMGPFLRPRMLDRVVETLLGARAFFVEPAANRAFLEEHGITHVILVKRFRLGYSPEAGGRPRPGRLRDVPFLEPMHRGSSFDAYRVVGVQGRGRFPDPSAHPAYDCRRDPLR